MDKYRSLIFLTIIVVSSLLLSMITIPTYTQNVPELPGITEWIKDLPVYTPTPGDPAVVYPGDVFQAVFREEYIPDSISGGYIYMVKLENNSLRLYNYTVNIVEIDSSTYNVSIPVNTEPGLYDLVLYGDKEYFIPRSVWVIEGLGDIIRIVHMSDLHFGTGTPNTVIGEYKRFTGLMLTQLLKPDMVINTGDEADTAATSQYIDSRAFRYIFLYPIPVFLNPGNHDWPNDNYYRFYGDTFWYRLIGGKILLIAINTRGEAGYPDYKQLVELKELLEKYRDTSIKIIQMHHPVFYWQGEVYTTYNSSLITNPRSNPNSIISYYWGGNITATRIFLKLCEDYNVSIVFAGHIHRDQYVLYHSIRTNTSTYFITTTTLAHGTGTYNGLQYLVLNLTKLNLSFPYAPPTFAGFNNIDRDKVYNSIHNLPPYYYGRFLASRHGYILELNNNLGYLSLSNTVLLAFPWSGEYEGLYVESFNGSSAQVVDHMIVNNILYIAIHIDLPSGSNLLMILYNMNDNNPPEITLKMSMPETPTLGRVNKLFFEITDNEWGVRSVEAKIIYMGMEFNAEMQQTTDTTYVITLRGYTGDKPKTVTILFNVTDYAGNTVLKYINITLYPPGWTPTTTVSPTENLTTSITTTSPGNITTPPINTTSPTPTPITTPGSTTSSLTTPANTTSSTIETGKGQDYTSLLMVTIIIVVLVIAVIVVIKK